MTRIRTHKSSKYFTVSNRTAQDENLSFEALGLLTYCLSMPQDWDFNPKVIWKQRKCGRKFVYDGFDELIATFHCIRISKPNPKAPNLAGEVSYEIFDDVEDCKAAIIELEKTEKFLEHGDNLNKSFRRSKSWDTESRDTESRDTTAWNNTKETEKENKQLSIVCVDSPPVGAAPPLEKPKAVVSVTKLLFSGEQIVISKQELFTLCIQRRKDWTAEEIDEVWKILAEYSSPMRDWFKFCEGTIINMRKLKGIRNLPEEKKPCKPQKIPETTQEETPKKPKVTMNLGEVMAKKGFIPHMQDTIPQSKKTSENSNSKTSDKDTLEPH